MSEVKQLYRCDDCNKMLNDNNVEAILEDFKKTVSIFMNRFISTIILEKVEEFTND